MSKGYGITNDDLVMCSEAHWKLEDDDGVRDTMAAATKSGTELGLQEGVMFIRQQATRGRLLIAWNIGSRMVVNCQLGNPQGKYVGCIETGVLTDGARKLGVTGDCRRH